MSTEAENKSIEDAAKAIKVFEDLYEKIKNDDLRLISHLSMNDDCTYTFYIEGQKINVWVRYDEEEGLNLFSKIQFIIDENNWTGAEFFLKSWLTWYDMVILHILDKIKQPSNNIKEQLSNEVFKELEWKGYEVDLLNLTRYTTTRERMIKISKKDIEYKIYFEKFSHKGLMNIALLEKNGVTIKIGTFINLLYYLESIT